MFAFSFCALIVLAGFILPFTQLTYWTLFVSEYAFDNAYWQLVLNSVYLASITAVAAISIALALSYMQRLVKSPISTTAVFTTGLGYAVPGTVIAVGVLIPFAAFDHSLNNLAEKYFGQSTGLLLSGSLFIVVFAYLVRFLAVALNNLQSGFLNIHQHMDEASRSLGQSAWQTVKRVHLPLLRPSLLSAALLIFVDTLTELPATLVLRPFNFNTLAVRSYELANEEQLANAAPAVITIVIAGLLPVILLNASMRDKHRQTTAAQGSSNIASNSITAQQL
jgi:iron(III) transport system permease protein